MATIGGPQIIKNGLVYHLDAANKKSYSGSGTLIRDLSGNSNNGTLINGPTFSSNNGGGIVFDGVDDGITVISTLPFPTNNFTYEVWCRPTTTHEIDTETTFGFGGVFNQRYLIDAVFTTSPNSGAGISIGTNGVSVYEHAPEYMPALLVSTTPISSTLATHIVVLYINKQPSLYINGIFNKVGLISPRTNVFATATSIGRGQYGHFQGVIHSVKVYNRALTPSEILQNYNGMRGRFAI
jgi:hypothetical protein